MQRADINRVRASVHQHSRSTLKNQHDRARNKEQLQRGLKQNPYTREYKIQVDDQREGNPPQLLSFSYTDIITRDIRMKLC